jgi:hypothetical protein
MNKLSVLAVWLLSITAISAQVGIGTLTPNTKSVLELNSSSKGLLLPRMTSTDRGNMVLSSSDAGMMVYQTTSPKGPYTWDGASWIYYAPIESGTANGYTLRWDGSKWASVNNLFNQGTSIGIGTQNPNYQLQINSSSNPNYTRFQITNAGTGTGPSDGLVLGIGAATSPGVAHLLQQENKALWFGTNNLERMRIDSAGRIGINTTNPNQLLHINGNAEFAGQLQITNAATAALPSDGLLLGCTTLGSAQLVQQENRSLTFGTNGIERVRLDSIGRLGVNTSSPSATLDVNGTFKLGTNGTSLASIMKVDFEIDPPVMTGFAEWICNIPCPNTTTNAVVYISPDITMDQIVIGYARVNSAGNVQVKFTNVSTSTINIGTVMLHIAVIQ